MMDTLVSIIVPVYKVEPFLKKCVDSIRQQTYSNLEIILIDDGSPDCCGKICDEYAVKDARIQVIHQKNKGLSEARNRGIDICKGSYIMFVDSDDYVESNAIECLLQASIETNADVTCCGYIKENGRSEISCSLTEVRRCYEEEEIFLASIDETFIPAVWNKLWKRELFDEESRFPAGRLFEDLSTNWKILNKCHRVTCVPDILYHYLIRKNGICNTKNMKNLVDHWLAYKERYDEMATKGENIQQICMKDCLETIGYTWRWLYGVDKKDRAEYENHIQDMRTFLKANSDMVNLCPVTTRVSLFCASHSNPVTEAGCYYLNRIYRKIRGMDKML